MKVYVTTGVCQINQDGKLGSGCVEADSVSEPLAITSDVLRLRGEWVLQNIGNDWRDTQATGPDIGNYKTGDITEVTGTDFGNFIGKNSSITYNDEVANASSTVNLVIKIIK